MNIKPFNRYLLVSPVEEKKEEKSMRVVLPTDYKKPENPYVTCTVDGVAEDSKFYSILSKDDTIVVERRMLNKIELNKKVSYLVLENYIYGRINGEV